MSYDIRIGVMVQDSGGLIVEVGRPEYDSPTYNLRDMFVACMDWNYKQGEWYKVTDVLPKIERGERELKFNKRAYTKYNPSNGWGNTESALECIESILDCIEHFIDGEYYICESIPSEYLWFKW